MTKLRASSVLRLVALLAIFLTCSVFGQGTDESAAREPKELMQAAYDLCYAAKTVESLTDAIQFCESIPQTNLSGVGVPVPAPGRET